jgi:hypothetical protein
MSLSYGTLVPALRLPHAPPSPCRPPPLNSVSLVTLLLQPGFLCRARTKAPWDMWPLKDSVPATARGQCWGLSLEHGTQVSNFTASEQQCWGQLATDISQPWIQDRCSPSCFLIFSLGVMAYPTPFLLRTQGGVGGAGQLCSVVRWASGTVLGSPTVASIH